MVLTQWRAGGMGVIGLDYAEVRWWAREMGIDMSPALWGKIRALERHELERSHGAESHTARRGGDTETPV
jgi:hypothetical protein